MATRGRSSAVDVVAGPRLEELPECHLRQACRLDVVAGQPSQGVEDEQVRDRLGVEPLERPLHAGDRQDLGPLGLKQGDQLGVDQRRFAGPGLRVEQDDRVSDDAPDQVGGFPVAAEEPPLVAMEWPGADVGGLFGLRGRADGVAVVRGDESASIDCNVIVRLPSLPQFRDELTRGSPVHANINMLTVFAQERLRAFNLAPAWPSCPPSPSGPTGAASCCDCRRAVSCETSLRNKIRKSKSVIW